MFEGGYEDDLLLEPLYYGQTIRVGEFSDSPVHYVKQVVTDVTRSADVVHPVFCEMMELVENTGLAEYRFSKHSWQESARWVKYQETVEEHGRRWSKPHVPLTTLPNIMQLRNCFNKGVVILDSKCSTVANIVDAILQCWKNSESLSPDVVQLLRVILLASKRHLYRARFQDVPPPSPTQTMGTDVPLDTPTMLMPPSPAPLSYEERRSSEYRFATDVGSSSVTSQSKTFSTWGEGKRLNTGLLRKVKPDAEAANVFVGRVGELEVPLAAFVRLKDSVVFHDMPEIPLPTRFYFVLLAPESHSEKEIVAIGECLGTLFVDSVFSQLAYRARSAEDLSHGIDEYLSQCLMIPPGKWQRERHWEPQERESRIHEVVCQDDHRRPIGPQSKKSIIPFMHHHAEGFHRTGRLFGGLLHDLQNKAVNYLSDFTDPFTRSSFLHCFGASVFMFFANLAIILCFSGVLSKDIEHQMSVTEGLVAGAICGVAFALFSGQPLIILGPTGHTLIFETMLFTFCKYNGWDYFPFRCWTGIWTGLIMVILVAFDMSVLVSMITKFAEEIFAVLVSLMFVIRSFQLIADYGAKYPIATELALSDPCVCTRATQLPFSSAATFFGNDTVDAEDPTGLRNIIDVQNSYKTACIDSGGSLTGLQCKYPPDVFLFSFILFASSFLLSYGFRLFGKSRYFTKRIRSLVEDFNVFFTIAVLTLISYLVESRIRQLHGPSAFVKTPSRLWFINPLLINRWWGVLVTIIPGILFCVLVVMDQQVAALIINRKENKLKKGAGYHLDIFILAFIIVLCGVLGIPFYVGSTVASILHEEALRVYVDCAAPGERPKLLGIREQRLTALFAHLALGFSVLLTQVLELIPLPVLFGTFLYLGVASMESQQIVQRVLLFFIPQKYQPDYPYLKVVPLRRVHIFTATQLVLLVVLFIVKFIKKISFIFPLLLIFLIVARKLLERYFTTQELDALDEPLPSLRNLLRPRKPGEEDHHGHHAENGGAAPVRLRRPRPHSLTLNFGNSEKQADGQEALLDSSGGEAYFSIVPSDSPNSDKH